MLKTGALVVFVEIYVGALVINFGQVFQQNCHCVMLEKSVVFKKFMLVINFGKDLIQQNCYCVMLGR